MNIRRNLRWLRITGVAGLVIFAAVAFVAVFHIEINGPVYRQISLSRDVVADYVPPSENLMGAALICSLMNDTVDPAQLAQYQTEFAAARRAFEESSADYLRRMPGGELKDLMRGVAYQTAEQYFLIAEREFIPLVLRGEHDAAQEILSTKMRPLYQEHAAAVDQIVAVANSESHAGEALAARLVASYTALMVGVGVLIVALAGLLFLGISRAITRQTDALVESEDELRKTSHARAEAITALERAHAQVEEQVRVRTAELLVAKESAESADRTKSAFLATMSHELRTPLNSIIGFTDIVLRELPGSLNPEQKKQLGMVQNSSRHLLALINDVLDISKIEAGELELRPAPFDVRRSVEKVVELIRPQARTKGLTLSADVASNVGTYVGDCQRAEQILLNLLGNAVKFTDRGAVSVRCAFEQSWLVVAVQDSGMGIAPEHVQQLFRPFSQVDSSLARRHEGTGLGLSICKRLVEMMGGSISVSSEPGYGSTFSYRLPAAHEYSQ